MNTVVLSLDYDGCSDILFPPVYSHIKTIYKEYAKEMEVMNRSRDFLLKFIDDLETENHVVLMCGSARQSDKIDKFLQENDKNSPSSVFEQLKNLDGQNLSIVDSIRAMNGNGPPREGKKKNWEYVECLVPDVDDIIKNKHKGSVETYLRLNNKTIKEEIVNTQVEYAKKRGDITEYYFIDDKADLLEEIHIKCPEPIIKLYQYDWFARGVVSPYKPPVVSPSEPLFGDLSSSDSDSDTGPNEYYIDTGLHGLSSDSSSDDSSSDDSSDSDSKTTGASYLNIRF